MKTDIVNELRTALDKIDEATKEVNKAVKKLKLPLAEPGGASVPVFQIASSYLSGIQVKRKRERYPFSRPI